MNLLCASFIPLLVSTTASDCRSSMMTSPSSCKMAVFSDIDGTLVHYPPAHVMQQDINTRNDDGDIDNNKNDLLYLPPSKTGQRGVISSKTLLLCQQLRNEGVPFVLVTGARSTTLFQRLPYLPRADAYVSESGGRIFYPNFSINDVVDGMVDGVLVHPQPYEGCPSSHLESFTLVEDLLWRNEISNLDCAGTDGYSILAPRAGSDGFSTLTPPIPIDQRSGKLWAYARSMQKKGFFLDSSGYATAFRINRKHQEDDIASTFDEFLEQCNNREGVPEELGCSTNLGCVDFYPKMSGKKNVCDYLIRKFIKTCSNGEDESITLKSHAYCLCDDDNDVEMALACRTAYLPSVTSESMRRLASESKNVIVTETEERKESLATEAALEMILNDIFKSNSI
jgi:hydroxymethylpyrimidine pyrophosphatase-like HAD family hydrolase